VTKVFVLLFAFSGFFVTSVALMSWVLVSTFAGVAAEPLSELAAFAQPDKITAVIVVMMIPLIYYVFIYV